ncbi:MAG: DNA translocase FtsK 4TM domain-containing protein [Polyangiaceae bacterium]
MGDLLFAPRRSPASEGGSKAAPGEALSKLEPDVEDALPPRTRAPRSKEAQLRLKEEALLSKDEAPPTKVAAPRARSPRSKDAAARSKEDATANNAATKNGTMKDAALKGAAQKSAPKDGGSRDGGAKDGASNGDGSKPKHGYAREAAALLLLASALYTSLALASFQGDPMRLEITGADWVGPVGAVVAGALVQGVGLCAWLVPFGLAIFAAPLLQGKPSKVSLVRVAGDLVVVLVASALLHVAFPRATSFGAMPIGGSAGELFGEVMRALFSTIGSYIVGLTVVSLILIGRAAFSIIDWAQRAQERARLIRERGEGGIRALATAWDEARAIEEKRRDDERRAGEPVITEACDEAIFAALADDSPAPFPRVKPLELAVANASARVAVPAAMPELALAGDAGMGLAALVGGSFGPSISAEATRSSLGASAEAARASAEAARPLGGASNASDPRQNKGAVAQSLLRAVRAEAPTPTPAAAKIEKAKRARSKKAEEAEVPAAGPIIVGSGSQDASRVVEIVKAPEPSAIVAVTEDASMDRDDGDAGALQPSVQASGPAVIHVADVPVRRAASSTEKKIIRAIMEPAPPTARSVVEETAGIREDVKADDASEDGVDETSPPAAIRAPIASAAPAVSVRAPIEAAAAASQVRASKEPAPAQVRAPIAAAPVRAPIAAAPVVVPPPPAPQPAPAKVEAEAPAELVIVDTSAALKAQKPAEIVKVVPAIGEGFRLPTTDMLDEAAGGRVQLDEEILKQTAVQLEKVLMDYGVSGKVEEIHPGPTVTTFEVAPAAGTKVSKVASLADDLALGLSRKVRIVAPIPGKNRIGFEIPNDRRMPVVMRELVEDKRFLEMKAPLPCVLGRDIIGAPYFADLASMPHVIVAGATGAGKSVGLNVMLVSLLYRRTPAELRLLMIDPKVVELAPFDGIPHMLLPVVTDMKQASNALKWAVDEMERRYQLFANAGTRNITSYNGWVERVRKGEIRAPKKTQPKVVNAIAPDGTDVEIPAAEDGSDYELPESLPFILIVVDEFADLMMQQGKEVEASVARLAQKARAAGMHVILATQRPSVDVITGMIKANFPTRIAFRVAQKVDSRTILDEQGAEHLLGRGDMLVKMNGSNDTRRVQCPFCSEEEVQRVTDFLRLQGTPVYDENILKPRDEDGEADDGQNDEELDQMYDAAVRIVADTRRCSTSWLQRKLGIGYNRAAKIVEAMEKRGVVGPANGAKDREVLIGQL